MASVAMLEMWAGHPTYPCDILYTPFFLARRAPSSRRHICGCSLIEEPQPSKLVVRVRFPPFAPTTFAGPQYNSWGPKLCQF